MQDMPLDTVEDSDQDMTGEYDRLRCRNGRAFTTFVDAQGNRRPTWGILYDLTGHPGYKAVADAGADPEPPVTRTPQGHRIAHRVPIEWQRHRWD
jgi:hypothetical protein